MPPTLDEIQAEWLDLICKARSGGVGSGVANAATGTGKTVLSAKFIKAVRAQGAKPALFVADMKTLITQADQKFQKWGPKTAVEMGAQRVRPLLGGKPDVVIASRQTLHKARLERWPRDYFDDLIIDEAHGATGAQFRSILGHFHARRFLLGLTATDYRSDGKPIYPDPFQGVIFRYPLMDFPDGRPGAITNGHLAPVRLLECGVGVELNGLRVRQTTHGKDFDATELEIKINQKVEVLANAALRKLKENGVKCAILFAPGVVSAINFADAFTALGYPAKAIYGDHPDREKLEGDFHAGRFNLLCNSDLYTKGYDHPPIEAVILVRPTMSKGLLWQMLGRGTRTCEGKACCWALGFPWSHEKHGPMTTLDLFLEGSDQRVKEMARNLLALGDGVDAMRLVKRSEVAVAQDIKREEADRKRKEEAREKAEAKRRERATLKMATRHRTVACRYREHDLNRGNITTRQRELRLSRSQSQAEILQWMKIPGHERFTPEEGAQAIALWQERIDAGFTSARQCDTLYNLGVPWSTSMELTGREAATLIQTLRGNRP